MEDIEKLKNNFKALLSEVDTVANFGHVHSEVVNSLLKTIDGDFNLVLKQTNPGSNVQAVFEIIKKLDEHPQIKPAESIVYAQAIVLVVSSFESCMNDLFITLVDKNPALISWEDKEMKISTDLLQYGVKSVGEFLLKNLKEKINFQNLEDTKRFLDSYLKIKTLSSISSSDTDTLLFYSQLRHLIVHNASKVDQRFFIRVSSLTNLDTRIKNSVVVDSVYKCSKNDYQLAKNVFEKYFLGIIKEVENKIS
jgi:hypothetical protein